MTLKELRNIKGLSQTEASKILSIPLRSYKRYELDKRYQGSIKYNFIFNELNKYRKQNKRNDTIRKSNVIITGIGYVGLSNGILLSKKANISFLDIDFKKVDLVNSNKSPIPNKDIEDAIKKSKFKATTEIYAYKNADFVFIATPTNFDEYTGSLDTFSVESVIRTIREINKRCLIIIKSTVPTGFTSSMIQKYGGNIVFCPEFLREKHALNDAFYPTRIIIGTDFMNKKVLKLQTLLEASIKNDEKVIYMSSKEAEATKLFSNTYLAMRVAFFNELDSFALSNNINSKNIIKGLGNDARIGDTYNSPSFMFEGSCLPKDTKETINELKNIDNNQLVSAISTSNQKRLEFIYNKIVEKGCEISHKNPNDLVIGIYDLDTDKISSTYKTSSSIRLLEYLKSKNIKCIVYDKNYDKSVKNIEEFFEKSDLVVSNENHKELKKIKNKFFTRSID